jgi:hypothetical protein
MLAPPDNKEAARAALDAALDEGEADLREGRFT